MLDSHPPLHMVQMVLDGRDLQRSAKRQRLPSGCSDTGYLLHGHLNALFGDLLPQPFHGISTRGHVEVVGYSRSDGDALMEQAETFAEPMVKDSLKGLSSKAMPTTWRAGRRLGFEVRVCPVVRLSSATPNFRAASEVDAFLAAIERRTDDAPLHRPAIYRQWLEKRLVGAARLDDVQLKQFRRTRLFRRTQERQRRGRTLERPDALLVGELEVVDAGAFQQLLERGIGRHRCFGFGMLRLRPPRS